MYPKVQNSKSQNTDYILNLDAQVTTEKLCLQSVVKPFHVHKWMLCLTYSGSQALLFPLSTPGVLEHSFSLEENQKFLLHAGRWRKSAMNQRYPISLLLSLEYSWDLGSSL